MTQGFSQMPRRAGARRSKVGIRLAADVPVMRQRPATRRWLETIEHMLSSEDCQLGEQLAREALVLSIDVRPGLVEGAVMPSLPATAPHPPTGMMQPTSQAPAGPRSAGPCTVRIHVPRHLDDTWNRAVTSLASDASAAAPLLAGELSGDLDDLLARHGAPLAPRRHELITLECSCAARGVCAHVAALTYVLADRLLAEPSLALMVRGLSSAELLDRVRQVRAAAARRSAASGAPNPTDTAAPAPMTGENALLEQSLDEFWRTGPELEDLAQLPPSNHAPHALLRRLGPSPLGGSFPLVGLLASAYDTIKAHAEKLRDLQDEEA